tara:strand:+ start:1112 stop:1564 length:453 start_codon:yes stop_codon:yes gene_type:complete
MKLTDNFSLNEMLKSQTALRKGISNKPHEPSVITNLQTLCEKVLQPVRENFGPVVINSGYRSPELNSAIGGSNKSQHMVGQAADIEVPTVSNKEVAEWIRDNLKFDQLILEFYNGIDPRSGWVHVSYADDNKNRNQTLTINRNGTFQGFV